MQNIPLTFVDGLNYTCTNCGKCCRSSQRVINVEHERAQEMMASPLYAKKVKEGYTPIILDQNSEYRLKIEESEPCAFLDENGCSYHSEYGGEKKPVPCQLYPFTLIKTPDGYFVSAAFSCPPVLAGVGPPLAAQAEDIRALLMNNKIVPQLLPVTDTVALCEHVSIGWQEYKALEAQLLAQWIPEEPVNYCLNAACLILLQCAQGAFTIPDFRPPCSIVSEAMNYLHFFLLNAVTMGEFSHDIEKRESFLNDLMEDRQPVSPRTGAVLFPYDYPGPTDLLTKDTITRYFRAQLQGKKLLSGPTVVTRLLLLATGISTMLYYQKALARSQGELHFSFQHLEQSFEILEDDFMTHSFDLESLFLEFERALTAIGTAK